MTESPEVRPIVALTLGHLQVDLCQGLVPALVPFLVTQDHYSYSAAAGLVFAASALSSIVQPLFGQLADRASIPHLLPGSVLLAGVALALGAQAQFYPLLLFAFSASGLGIAAFHPEAARRTFQSAGSYRTTAMSYFSLGGSVGFALAPMVGAICLTQFGRAGILAILPFTVATAAILGWLVRKPAQTHATGRKSASPAGIDHWRGFWTLAVGVIARSIVFFGINSFLVLFWQEHWQVSLQAGTTALSVFLLSGVAGTLLGGWAADRIGRRAVLQMGFAAAFVLFPLSFLMPSPLAGLILLGMAAMAFFAPSSPAVVLGQEYLPTRVGVASGVTIGLAVSTGGMAAPLLGLLGDQVGLATVFLVLECLLFICTLSTFFLPAARRTTGDAR